MKFWYIDYEDYPSSYLIDYQILPFQYDYHIDRIKNNSLLYFYDTILDCLLITGSSTGFWN